MNMQVTPFAHFLAAPDIVASSDALASAWFDQSLALRLAGCSLAPELLGAHLRRSFLGALGPGGSEVAQAGKPCDWDPPCALDVFCREQLRHNGAGLPKPYVLWAERKGRDLIIRLRVFGAANDWFAAAADGLVRGLREILPWQKLGAPRPRITDRRIEIFRGADLPPCPPGPVVLHLLSPIDIASGNPAARPRDLLIRALFRVDAMARWSGVAASENLLARLKEAGHALSCEWQHGQTGTNSSANKSGQLRIDPVMRGALTLSGDLAPFWPILMLATRAHLGRKTNEGLGVVRLHSSLPELSLSVGTAQGFYRTGA